MSSTLDPRIILHENSHRLGIELQRSSEVCETTLAEFTQLSCARRAKIFRDLGNFFARVGHKICVTPTLDACFFGFECISGSFIQRTATLCSMRSARWPNARNFCARGVPDFRKFANFSREFCAKFASSRRWTRASSCIKSHADSEKSCNEVLQCVQPRWPSSRNFCARGAPKFFGDFCIFSREFGAKFA